MQSFPSRWLVRQRVPLLMLGVAAVMLLAAACGGDEEEAATQPAQQPTTAPAASEEEKPTLVFADNQFESLWINQAILEFIIENAYGYPTERVEVTTPIAQQSLSEGDADIWLEMWQQNWIDNYNELINAGKIENLGDVYEGGPQFWVVPTYFAEEHGIETIEDMKQSDVMAALEDPENPDKGAFVNCPSGWQCGAINPAKIKAYGLDEYYSIVEPGSGAALKAELAGAQQKEEPVFGYYWAPTSLMGRFDWTIVEEPEYSDACWEEVAKGQEDPDYVPSQACAYEVLPIDIGVHQSMMEKAPDVVELLKNTTVGLEPINKTAAWAEENDVDVASDVEKVAAYYLKNFEDRWTTWMPADKVQKVKEAVANR